MEGLKLFSLNNHSHIERAAFNFKNDRDITIGDYLLARLEQLGVTVGPMSLFKHIVILLSHSTSSASQETLISVS